MLLDNDLMFFEAVTETPDAATVNIDDSMVDGSCLSLFFSAKMDDGIDSAALAFSVTDATGAEIYSFDGTLTESCIISAPLPAGWAGDLTCTVSSMSDMTCSAGITMHAPHTYNFSGTSPYSATSSSE